MDKQITTDERATMRKRARWGGYTYPADVLRLLDALDIAEAEVERLRSHLGDCHCDKNPATTNGPEEDCPQHGRPVAEVWGIVERAQAERDEARAEVARLRAAPAPVWDEDAVKGALTAANLPHVLRTMSDGYPSVVVRDADEAAEVALAVVREHLPVRPDRETVPTVADEYAPRFSCGGFIPGPPIHATVRRLDHCVCGEPLYSLDDGPPEHLVPAGTTFEAFRDWARRCPLLQAEEARAQAAADKATTGTGTVHTYWVPAPTKETSDHG